MDYDNESILPRFQVCRECKWISLPLATYCFKCGNLLSPKNNVEDTAIKTHIEFDIDDENNDINDKDTVIK